MRTQPINSAEKNNTNVIAAGAVGAVAGGLATRYLPLTHGEFVNKGVQAVVNAAKDTEFERITKEIANNSSFENVGDVFVKNKKSILEGAGDKISDAAKGLSESGQETFKGFVKRIKDVVSGPEAKTAISEAKKSRPVFYVAALSAVGLMTFAALKNMIEWRRAEYSKIAINYDDNGVTIDAPDDTTLSILLDQTV